MPTHDTPRIALDTSHQGLPSPSPSLSSPSTSPSNPRAPAALPPSSPSLQSQIHDYTKNMPPQRKQNTACDACRARKVKCNRLPGQEKCQHCLSKSYPCTHYVQQATSEKKRNASLSRRPRNLSGGGTKYPAIVLDPSGQPTAVLGRFATPPSPCGSSPAGPIVSPILENGSLAAPIIPLSNHTPLSVRYGFSPQITPSTPARELLSYIFAPPENTDDPSPFPTVPGRRRSPYDPWGDQASRLEQDHFKAEFAWDLVEVYFQIVHTRQPLLNPDQFRRRLQAGLSRSSTDHEPLHPALVATVLAWGSKFSEHLLLAADRRRPGGQSLLAKTLINRARDLAEALKVHRIPKPDHVIIALLIEPLQSQIADDPTGFRGFWLTAATRHLLDLQYNHRSVLGTLPDAEYRGTMVFAWWMACFSDAYASAYYRRKPVLDDGDYDIDFYTADPVEPGSVESQGSLSSPREQLATLGYYGAAHSLARAARYMSRELWKPVTDSQGIALETLQSFALALTEWRDKYLHYVGVPSNFKGDWDFVSAVSSCASDATYHVMWIILFNALDDFGIREVNNQNVKQNDPRVEEAKKKVLEEALHGALRIAGLAAVLTSNGYLKLDPAVMHVSCIQAGTLLARLGRQEVKSCIQGLEQYSHSYEEAGEQALEMGRIYTQALAGEPQFNKMGNAVPRSSPDLDEDMEPPPTPQTNHTNHHTANNHFAQHHHPSHRPQPYSSHG